MNKRLIILAGIISTISSFAAPAPINPIYPRVVSVTSPGGSSVTVTSITQLVDVGYLTNWATINTNILSLTEVWTNQNGSYIYLTGQGPVVEAGASRPGFFFRPDGSLMIGTNVTKDTLPTASGIFVPYVVSMTDSNEPNTITAGWFAVDNVNQSVYGSARFVMQQGGLTTFQMIGDNGPENREFKFQIGPGFDAITYYSNTVPRFLLQESGSLAYINGLNYLGWPTAHGGANAVLADIDNAGTLRWTNIAAIVTNNQARIGPGTNNWFAKFNVVGGTNVGNGVLYSDRTNLLEFRPRPDGGNFNVGFTNNIMGRETSGGDTNWLQIIAGAAGSSELHHIRAMATGATQQRLGILINDSWLIEPPSNQLAGHNAGDLSPNTGDTYTMGSANSIKSITMGTGFISLGVPASTSFPGIRVGAPECGISSRGVVDLSFWRPSTGLTAAFDKGPNGELLFDIAGNGLGFGTGISNVICGFLTSGMAGLVQVSTTNSTTATPGTHGIMGAQGSGTDKGGGDLRLVGGPSTGTGTNGNVRLQTAEKANSTSSSLNSSFKDRIFIISDPIILTTNSATTVFSFTVPTTLKAAGIKVIAHTEIENGVDGAATDEDFLVNAFNKAGTLTVSNPSAPQTTSSSSGGSATIVNTWTAVATGTRVDVKLTCVTSGILSTNSTCRVTLIPNSSAVPVITHP